MTFTSGTQALQGRTVNHDPYPYQCTDPAHPQPHRLTFNGIKTRFAPRDEFAVLDNPILAEARRRGWTNPVHYARLIWCIDHNTNAAPGFIELDYDQFTPASDEQINHARRVLAKLAALSEELP